MKFVLIFVVAFLALCGRSSGQDNCIGRPVVQICTGGRDEGNNRHWSCAARFTQEMWYYNSAARDCQKMRYLGCGGNNNRYCSLHHCRRKCR